MRIFCKVINLIEMFVHNQIEFFCDKMRRLFERKSYDPIYQPLRSGMIWRKVNF